VGFLWLLDSWWGCCAYFKLNDLREYSYSIQSGVEREDTQDFIYIALMFGCASRVQAEQSKCGYD